MISLHAVTSRSLWRTIGLAALGALARFGSWCARCQARAEQRRALAQLDDSLLHDVGVAPSAARAEAGKPWWRA